MDLRINGEVIPVVIQVTKMGMTFVLHRETGEPVFPVEERPVPQGAVPGEYLSPTQPFPSHIPQSAAAATDCRGCLGIHLPGQGRLSRPLSRASQRRDLHATVAGGLRALSKQWRREQLGLACDPSRRAGDGRPDVASRRHIEADSARRVPEHLPETRGNAVLRRDRTGVVADRGSVYGTPLGDDRRDRPRGGEAPLERASRHDSQHGSLSVLVDQGGPPGRAARS